MRLFSEICKSSLFLQIDKEPNSGCQDRIHRNLVIFSFSLLGYYDMRECYHNCEAFLWKVALPVFSWLCRGQLNLSELARSELGD